MKKNSILTLIVIMFTMFMSCKSNNNDDDITNDVSSNKINGHEYVDLGLSVKWATCNVGANYPNSFGNYYAWGELNPKSYYSYDNCHTYNEELDDISGKLKYDVARKMWGGTWRMPTRSEMDELVNNCNWELEIENNFAYYRIIGPNGNYISLPATGYFEYSYISDELCSGQYWTSTPYTINDYNESSYALIFSEKSVKTERRVRYLGRTIRPVSD